MRARAYILVVLVAGLVAVGCGSSTSVHSVTPTATQQTQSLMTPKAMVDLALVKDPGYLNEVRDVYNLALSKGKTPAQIENAMERAVAESTNAQNLPPGLFPNKHDLVQEILHRIGR